MLKEEVEEAQESPYVRRVGRYVQVEKHLKTCKKFLSPAVEKNLQLTENVEQETEKQLYWQCIRETTEENDESCTQPREYLKQSKSRSDTLSSIVKNSTKSTASSAKLRLEASLRLQELERRAEENIRLVKTKADLELNANRKKTDGKSLMQRFLKSYWNLTNLTLIRNRVVRPTNHLLNELKIG